jgi:hypothetical protein
MASHLNDYFDPFVPVTLEQVTFTAGVTGLNEMIAFNLTDDRDGISLGRPIYGSFYDDLMTKSRYLHCSHITPVFQLTTRDADLPTNPLVTSINSASML